MKTTKVFVASILALSAGSVAQASVITTLPGGTAIPIPGLDLITNSSSAIGGGITFTSDVPGGSLLGGTGATVFGNGSFGPGNPYLSLGVAANGYNYATMALTFATPTSAILGEFRWTDGGPGIGNLAYNSASIHIYDINGNLLEYFQFNNNANFSGRAPGYYGFSRATADIASIRFSNAFMGVRNLSYIGPEIGNPGGVPEPASWALMIAGFGMIGGAMRRREHAAIRLSYG
jgi:PEP-CTERM motif